MKRNNFDQSSTGINIETNCYFDNDISSYEFDESIQMLQHDSYRKSAIGYYFDNGNVENADSITFKLTGDKDALNKYFAANFTAEDLSENEKRQEIIDSLSPSLIDYEIYNANDFLNSGLSFEPSKTLTCIQTRGYSQGDFARVYYCPDDLQKAWGTAPKADEIQKIIDHLFWDAPIYAKVTVNGVEYDYEGDRYEWERQSFAEQIAEDSGVEISKILELLPLDIVNEG